MSGEILRTPALKRSKAANARDEAGSFLNCSDAKEAVMRQLCAGGLVGMLAVAGLIGSAPLANAGCQYGGGLVEKMCDGPVQDDGTWQRCVTQGTLNAFDRTHCQMMGPGQNPLGLAYYNPATHIDD